MKYNYINQNTKILIKYTLFTWIYMVIYISYNLDIDTDLCIISLIDIWKIHLFIKILISAYRPRYQLLCREDKKVLLGNYSIFQITSNISQDDTTHTHKRIICLSLYQRKLSYQCLSTLSVKSDTENRRKAKMLRIKPTRSDKKVWTKLCRN